jgi:predicted dinucleotide-binding enzyme
MDKLPPRTRRAEARTVDGIAIVGAGRLGAALAAALADDLELIDALVDATCRLAADRMVAA